jgi:hypothetical protein
MKKGLHVFTCTCTHLLRGDGLVLCIPVWDLNKVLSSNSVERFQGLVFSKKTFLNREIGILRVVICYFMKWFFLGFVTVS